MILRKISSKSYSLVVLNRTYLVFIFLFISIHSGVSQNQKQSLRSVLITLEEDLDISFAYADETIENIQITVPAKSLTLKELIIYLEDKSGLNFYQLDERFITISRPSLIKISICGYLIDAVDKVKIVGATVQVDNIGKVSSDEGYFSFDNISESSVVQIRMLGYEPLTIIAIELIDKSPCSRVELSPEVTRLNEVMVKNYITSGINKQLNGSFKLNIDELGLLPGLTEPDVLQTIQVLPGIQSINETVSHINIRGGTNDQNLVLWDGVKMYQTGHFFGLISAFNPYTSKEVTLIKNGASASLYDGVSGTIDIKTDDQIAKNISGGAGINMINVDGFVKLPLSNKMSIELSARRSITDIIKTPIFNNYFERAFINTDVTKSNTGAGDTTFNTNENFFFYDIGANFLYDIGKKDKIRIHFLNIVNKLDYQENFSTSASTETKTSSLSQNSLALSGEYRRLWNNKFSTRAEVYLSSYSLGAVNFDVVNNQRLIQENDILDTGIKLESLWSLGTNWDLLSGYQFMEVGISSLEDLNNPEFRRYIKEVMRTHAVFAEANYISKSNRTNLRFGLRANYFEKFDLVRLEPRISFNQKIFGKFSFELLGELKSQTATQIIDLQNDFLGVEKRRWVLSNQNDIPIIRSEQVSAGLNFNKNGLLISLEGFYKHVTGITSSSQGFQNQFQFVRASGEYVAKGIEVLVNKHFYKITTWASYSLTDNKYNFNEFVPPEFSSNLEIIHTAAVGISAEVKPFELSTGLNWRSGKPYTLPSGVNNNTIEYQVPNAARLPEYLRVDFSVRYKFNLSQKVRAHIGASVWNLTNNKNIINIYYLLDDTGNIKEIQQSALGITPNIIFRISF